MSAANLKFLSLLAVIPIMVAHLAGGVVALILLVRYKSKAATLALIGFGLLFLVDLSRLAQGSVTTALTSQLRSGPRTFVPINAGLNCCCSVIDIAGVICLIIALWQAIGSGGKPVSADEGKITSTNDLEQEPSSGAEHGM